MKTIEKPYTVMIVDDSGEDRYILKRYLKKSELPLVILDISTGKEGIELLMKSRKELESLYPGIRTPVILFLDINMPVMNGWEFIEELERQQDKIEMNPTVVLMYSTSDSDYDKNKSKGYKTVSNYIVKSDLSTEIVRKAITSIKV